VSAGWITEEAAREFLKQHAEQNGQAAAANGQPAPQPEPAATPITNDNGNSENQKLREEGWRHYQAERDARPQRRRFGPYRLSW
jgi:hypothetical protein